MLRIKNGGIELGLLKAIESDKELTPKEKERKEYLDSLQKDTDVYLDDNGKMINKDSYIKGLTKNLKVKNSD